MTHPTTPAAPPPASPRKSSSSPQRKAGTGLVAIVLVALAVWFSISVLPRWWAQRVGDQVHGDLTTGAILGFMYGFFAMLLPLIVLGLVYRFGRRSVRSWVIGGLIALVLASPNLITLGIAVGVGSSAHAADRTLDVDAPYFRGGMVIGAGAALLLTVYFGYVMRSRRRSRERAEQAERRSASSQTPPPTGSG